MKKLQLTILTLSIFALFPACQKMGGEIEKMPSLVLEDENQTLIHLEAGTLEPVDISFTSVFQTADLVLEVEAEQNWCTAEFKDERTLRLIPTEAGLTEQLKATIRINGKEGLTVREGKTRFQPEETAIFVVRKAVEIKKSPALSFVPTAQEFKIPVGSSEALVLHYKSQFQEKDLVLSTVEGEDWCTAAFTEEHTITVTPSADFMKENKVAKFLVEGKTGTKAAEIFKPTPVQFTVKRNKIVTTTKPVLGISGYNNLINVGPGWVKSFVIPANYSFPLETITVTIEADNNWCEALLTEEGIKIVPSDLRLDEDLETTFTFSSTAETEANGVIYQAADVKITIMRPAN